MHLSSRVLPFWLKPFEAVCAFAHGVLILDTLRSRPYAVGGKTSVSSSSLTLVPRPCPEDLTGSPPSLRVSGSAAIVWDTVVRDSFIRQSS